MKKIWYPEEIKNSILEIDLVSLKQKGMTTIICDVDNTLCLHDENQLSTQSMEWIKKAQSLGMKVILISNNHSKRVERIARLCNCDAYGFALKPLPHTYYKICKDHHLNAENVVCIGDQLFTDILGAKGMKFHNIYVKPLSESDIIYTKLSRKIENWLLKEKL